MSKDYMKKKVIIPDNTIQYLSAQEYYALTDSERADLELVLAEAGLNPDQYMRHMESLYPKKFTPKPLIWRHK